MKTSKKTVIKQKAKRPAAAVRPAPRPARPTPSPRSMPSNVGAVQDHIRGKAQQVKGLSSYMEMILDPHRSTDQTVRYPDETIVPTAIVSLQDSDTFVVPATINTQVPGTVYTALSWKVTQDDVQTSQNERPISIPAPLDTALALVDMTKQAYTQQANWLSLSSVDRSLALGIRVRLVALPTATFMPSGTIYFIQYQNAELTDLYFALATQGESAARANIAAKKGFSCTINEMSKTDGVTIPYLPQGPMSFVFSDSRTSAAANAGLFTASTVVSANGGVIVVGYGLQEGQTLRFDYGHVVEYIPRGSAAGLIQTAVQPPSSAMRDSISAGAAVIQQTIAGSTNLSSIAQVVAGGAMSAAASVAKGVIAGVPGASAVVKGLGSVAESLGAPAWLKSALGSLA